MTFERKLARLFNLTDENWMKHSNPLSVWSRFTVLPVIVFSFWSRLWIGWWCLLPVAASILWLFLNPVLFNKPKSTRNWASKSVLGERVYLNRDTIKIPAIHKTPLLMILNGIAALGLFLTIWSTVYYSVAGTVIGIVITIIGKTWFLDRMVWLYEDMKDYNKTYKSWDY